MRNESQNAPPAYFPLYIFSAFYGQRSVTAAWATRSPWSIPSRKDKMCVLRMASYAGARCFPGHMQAAWSKKQQLASLFD